MSDSINLGYNHNNYNKEVAKEQPKEASVQNEAETAGTIALYSPAPSETAGTIASSGGNSSSSGNFSAMA